MADKRESEGMFPNLEVAQEEVVKYEEIAELAEPAGKILEGLREELEHGMYPLIIGIDDSGRIPALLMTETISRIYEKRGMSKPQTFFFPSYATLPKEDQVRIRELQKANLAKMLILKPIDLKDKKVLIVDDTFRSGQSLEAIVLILNDLKISTDIAVMALMKDEGVPQPLAEFIQHPSSIEIQVRVFAGKRGRVKIYRNSLLSGVRKTKYPFTQGLVSTYKAGINTLRKNSSKSLEDLEKWKKFNNKYGDGVDTLKAINVNFVARARQDIKILAGRLAETFEKKSVPQ